MSELVTFVQLGFHHIVDPEALDHILFLFALAAIYRGREWRNVLWVVTAFTVGHSVTLALAVGGAVRFPTPVIEFLIPVTIVVTGLENLLVTRREHASLPRSYRPAFAAVFGLVHGAGFANYLRSLFIGPIGVPLLGFNLGIELGQVVVLAVAAVALGALDQTLGGFRAARTGWSVHRLRVLAVSIAVVLIASEMAIARRPW